jgi:hypothetical protein
MAYSVLVGPSREETTTLTDTEYETLKNALRLARSEDKQADAIAHAVRGCTEARGDTFRWFFNVLLSRFGEHSDELRAMLVEGGEDPIFITEEEGVGSDHFSLLKAFLEIMRADGWLAEFFRVRIEMYAKKTPTPLEFMRALTEEAANFEYSVGDAKRMMRDWPEFFTTQAANVEAPRKNGTVEAKPSVDEAAQTTAAGKW